MPAPSSAAAQRPKPTARHTRRREEMLHVAAAVFAEQGYHGASMRDIARKLGVQQAAIYYYFPSKAEILEAICRVGITEFLEAIEAIRAADLPSDEKIRRGVRAHLAPLIERRFYVHAFLYLRRDLPAAARRPLDKQARVYEDHWRAILEEGQRRGTLAKSLDAELAMRAILGMCNTVARWSRASPAPSLDRVADSFARLVLGGVAGETEKKRKGR